METRMIQSFLDSVKYIWIEWQMRSMVILSLLLQILLITLGNRRKYSSSTWVGVVIWAAYLLSDSVATFSLGIISTAQTSSSSVADKSVQAWDDVMVFWAPFLLVHLGGPDTITAYSLEDNELWLRHLIGLVVQVGLVFYLLVLSWIRSSINNNPLQVPLIFIAIPVLLSGLLKYGERIWVLWSASNERFRKSLLRPAQSGLDYAELMVELRRRMNMGDPLRYGTVEEPPRINQLPPDVIPEAELLVTADRLFNIFKSLYADLILDIQDHTDGLTILGHRSPEDAFKVIEIELGFMYDVLYSKASVAHSPAGFVLRSINFASFSAAFLAFFKAVDKHNFSPTNIIITYLLLVGAIFLEIYAVVMLIFSEWTLLRLKKQKKCFGNFLYRFISACPSASMNRKRWSGSIAQFNLIGFCIKDKPALYDGIQRFFGIYEPLEIARYKTWEKVTIELKKLIFTHIKERTATAASPKDFKLLCSNRGDYTLRKNSLLLDLSWSVYGVEFDHSILLWHIATDLCYYSDLNSRPNTNANPSLSSEAILCKSLSDYMLYILVLRPYMLPKGVGEIRYRDTCAEATKFISQRSKTISSRAQACVSLLEVEMIVLPEIAKGNESMSVLFDGCRLAKSLQESQFSRCDYKWDMMMHVWIEMLCYAATQCKWKPHIQQLSRGGELLTHVGLLMAHLGLSEQFQVSAGISKGICLP